MSELTNFRSEILNGKSSQCPLLAEMIDAAEGNIRADYLAGKISKEQFQKEMLIVARARHDEEGAKDA